MSLLNNQGLDILVDEVRKDINKKVNAIGDNLIVPKDNTKYTTVNGIKEFDSTSDGYIDNIYIEGATYVNYINSSSILTGESSFLKIDVNNKDMFDNGDYTIINLSDKIVRYIIRNNTGSSRTTTVQPKSRNFTILTDEHFSGIYGDYSEGWTNDDYSKTVFDKSILILKGKVEDTKLEHFKGIQSIGQGKCNLLTYGISNNIIPENLTYLENTHISSLTGELSTAVNGIKVCNEFISIEGGNEYTFSDVNGQVAMFDENKNLVPYRYHSLINTKNINFNNLFCWKIPSNVKFIKINLPMDNTIKPSIVKGSKLDKQKINTIIRSVPSGLRDIIFKQCGKYYKIKRCKEIVLDGTCTVKEDSSLYNDTSIKPYIINMLNDADISETNTFDFYCDKFKTKNIYNVSITEEGIYYSKSKNFHLRILKSKLETPNADGVKKWLETNPITIVYKLANPIIEELPNFNPRTFKGNNVIIIDSSIPFETQFEHTNSLRTELEVVKDIIQKKSQTIHYSTVAPTNDQGEDGDIWVIYSEEGVK